MIGRGAVYGMVLMTVAMQIVPFSDGLAKILTGEHGLSPSQTAWGRIFFAALFLAPVARVHTRFRRGGKSFLRLMRPYWLRGACWAGATLCFFAALKSNPLPQALSLLFVSPLFVAIAAPFFLREKFLVSRLGLLLAGFAGVLIVLRPASDDFSPSLLWALGAGLCYGGYLMATRRGGELGAGAGTFMMMLAACILVLPFAAAEWRTPSLLEWSLMGLMGGLSAAGHFLITKSCEHAEASQVAPFNYTEMAGALAVSYLFFGELPLPLDYAGIALIMSAGVGVAVIDGRQR